MSDQSGANTGKPLPSQTFPLQADDTDDAVDTPADSQVVRRDRILLKPRRLDDLVRARLVEAVGKGASYEIAANYAGISHGTLVTWVSSGYDIDQILVIEQPVNGVRRRWEKNPTYLLLKELKEAAATAAMKWLVKINEEEDWRASWAMLQARYPETYGKKTEVRVGSISKAAKDEAQRAAEELGLDPEELLALAAALAQEDDSSDGE